MMPIRAENKARYPAHWPKISREIRDRANHKCEKCRAPNGEMIRRGKTKAGEHVWRLASESAHCDGVCAETGLLIPDTSAEMVDYGDPVKVILTVAHLDHQPENCDPANLRAWCQRCHNVYDAPMRKAGIKSRARAACAAADMFGGDE